MQPPSRKAAERLARQARRLIRQGDFQRAVPACRQLNQQYPDFAEGWFTSSRLLVAMGMARQALDTVDRALALSPGSVRFALHRLSCLLAAGRAEEARKSALMLTSNEGLDAGACAALAQHLIRLDEHEAARSLYGRGVRLEPDNDALRLNLAIVHQFLGDLDAAAAECDRVIALNADNHDAYLLRASLHPQSAEENHVAQLRGALEAGVRDPLGRAKMLYALAKELEDLGRYPESFAALAQGAASYRSQLNYDLEEDLRFLGEIARIYDARLLASPPAGCDEAEPIFILGLPRTGSTLLERILGGHSQVHSAGELTHFTRRLVDLTSARHPRARPSREEMVALTATIDFRALGKAYLDSARAVSGGRRHFIDKFPQNSLNIGPIRLALPGARIVLVERHPMDTCYAIFKQLFTDIYPFSYDLEELGRYYVGHQRLMRHWKSVLGERIHVVRYEDLVADTEAAARAALEFCGLDWEPACLEFRRNRQASRTASASQVRRPIYTSSVGRWRCYEQELEPLRQRLAEAGCLEGWEDAAGAP